MLLSFDREKSEHEGRMGADGLRWLDDRGMKRGCGAVAGPPAKAARRRTKLSLSKPSVIKGPDVAPRTPAGPEALVS